ncbi:hypothetical protein PVAP13_8KG120201 [Panicum virgatum]|nr:hypothetical protein PVAP13_8KG120201 [Panicum virgatum]
MIKYLVSWWDSLRNEENEKSISNLSLLYIAGGTLRLLDDITWHFVLPYIGALMQGQEGEAAAEEAKKSNHVQRRAVQSGSF